MMPRDERLAGRAPVWAWDALQEDPPYPPGYTPRRVELSPEDSAYTRQRFAELDAENNPDAPPPNPDDYSAFGWDTADADLMDGLHVVKVEKLLGRLPAWTRTADGLDAARRLLYWQTKREAFQAVRASGYLSADLLGQVQLEEALDEAVRLAADAAAWAAPDATSSAAETVTLAPKSRANDKWGPLLPALRLAFTRCPGGRTLDVQQEWARICRSHPELRDYCRSEGIDESFAIQPSTSVMSRLKSKALELR